MRYTVLISIVLFVVTVIVLIYYAVYIDHGQFLIGNTNKALDILMLSLVVIAGVITGIVYLFNSRAGIGGDHVQTVQY
ncbi:MAG: hypothetical protein RXN89_05915 [Vulcanisaeta sp.]|jgi:divalent metal cation (Fe/Co/Zn/Cd) transporter|uniref:hypothetical protein n=1 Tax=Vulcanisaeta sp. EB80 TaxID=1650660 RepID=UPI0009BD1490|nr:hypothetical protein [Vulcanisaeta sp. EB80]MCG2864259.1 hypothetical protein [Vulcanisaeta sp.]MCG2867340.1 hypothetical protein [Vulcanisaeta sp.]MCG2886087.1 hypothetical protein [Vulcanisaeta sp.]MDT7862933.1 hypothetical protein [Vulcanisaeta sp.]PLC68824.1 hypothetical protein B7L70_01000 [Vulcanisaeta sp. EB80]